MKKYILSIYTLLFLPLLISCTDINLGETVNDNFSNNTYRIFYYHCADNCYYYKDINLQVDNSNLINALTEELKKEVIPGVSVLPANLHVNNIKIDKDKDLLIADLSKDYYDAIKNTGSSVEGGLLDSVKFTYCYNNNINNFTLLIDGKPYSGNHIIFEEGESFPVRYEDINKYLKPLNN